MLANIRLDIIELLIFRICVLSFQKNFVDVFWNVLRTENIYFIIYLKKLYLFDIYYYNIIIYYNIILYLFEILNYTYVILNMMYIIIYYIFILYRLSQLIFNVYLVIFYMHSQLFWRIITLIIRLNNRRMRYRNFFHFPRFSVYFNRNIMVHLVSMLKVRNC